MAHNKNCPEQVYRNAIIEKLEANAQGYNAQVRILTNKEFCSACARGEGCGAVFFNELTPLGRNKNLVSLDLSQEQVTQDRLVVGDIIKLQTARQNFWLAITIFYIAPMLLAIMLPLGIGNYLHASDLSMALSICLCLIVYFALARIYFKHKQLDVSYAGLELNQQTIQTAKYTGSYKSI
ncbi:SoxR reducing system RseC family protein [Psittacicella hinzii]|uniref:Positive regulator of sigma(E), RseC/MucC n=1 Tax=Psittacicella hinzii TaxID=2028575 RepID=A0A3A1YHM6_9GAMM|nr:SoxR reducing system RseC family protein [Psittacicella hinzii]RIY35734.1 hypothetical protein CKF58_06475 [Psittacicella hinzii]